MSEPGLSDVFDLFYPSPPTLKELASIQVALDLWRREIIGHRTNNTLDDLDLKSNLQLSTLIPNTPTVYLTNIEKFAVRVGPSIESWLKYHIGKTIFEFEILKNFVDFACDFDGKIHYKRTAKRMMLCDGISDDVKFKIACQNCFEDEILKLWPSVESRMNLENLDMRKLPQSSYWICRLKNQLNEIPGLSEYGAWVDEILSMKVSSYWPSLEYFLNRLNSDTRSKRIIKLIKSDSCSSTTACRYLLTKLNETELRILMATKEICHFLIFHSLKEFSRYEVEVQHVLRAWSYIKSIIPPNEFVTLIYAILSDHIYNASHSKEDYPSLCEIWTSAPNHLKQAFLLSIQSDRSFLRMGDCGVWGEYGGFVSFLLAVLSDMSIADRKKFWTKYWRILICHKQRNGSQRLANLCFSDPTELEQFKMAKTSNYENIKDYCRILLEGGHFLELDEFLHFCCIDEQTVRDFKLKILAEDFQFDNIYIKKTNLFNQFINDAYTPNVHLACHLKWHILGQAAAYNSVEGNLRDGDFRQVMEFVDAFSVNHQRAERFKRQHIWEPMISVFGTKIFREMSTTAGDDLSPFMSWFLETDGRTVAFKHNLSVDNIVNNQIKKQPSWDKFTKDDLGRRIRQSKTKYDYFLIKFLEWFFVTNEALEKFKAKYADNEVFVELTTM